MSATVHLTKKRRQINPSSCICSVTLSSGLPSSWRLVRLNQVQWWSTSIISGLETMMCKERLRFGFVQSRHYLMEDCREDGGRLFLEVQDNRKKGSWHKLENGKFLLDMGNISSCEWSNLSCLGALWNLCVRRYSECNPDKAKWPLEIPLNLHFSVILWSLWTHGNKSCKSIAVFSF